MLKESISEVMFEGRIGQIKEEEEEGKGVPGREATDPASAEWFCTIAKLTMDGVWTVKELFVRIAEFGGRFGMFQMYWCKWCLETEEHLGIRVELSPGYRNLSAKRHRLRVKVSQLIGFLW